MITKKIITIFCHQHFFLIFFFVITKLLSYKFLCHKFCIAQFFFFLFNYRNLFPKQNFSLQFFLSKFFLHQKMFHHKKNSCFLKGMFVRRVFTKIDKQLYLKPGCDSLQNCSCLLCFQYTKHTWLNGTNLTADLSIGNKHYWPGSFSRIFVTLSYLHNWR